MDADVIVVGAGLAGLVATHELTRRGKKVAVIDQENRANLGGQAFWSFGGIFLVNSPEQRHSGVKDSFELAWNDWFILTQKIIGKEFALSGSEQNPDVTAKDRRAFLRERLLSKGAPSPVEALKKHGKDFVVSNRLDELVGRMNALTDEPLLDPAVVRAQMESRDLQIANPFSKDAQVQGIRNSRGFPGDRLGRTAVPHRILDPDAGPLIGVKLHILTRKTLGGIQTDLSSRALGTDGHPIDGLYAAGEVAGLGGGGVHGYNALEGTFLGGCIFSGRAATDAL